MIPSHQSEKTKQSKIVVNRLSTLTDYDFSHPHRHEYFEFFCFLNGGGEHMIDFTDVPIESFQMHIVAPGQVHQVNRALDSHGYVYLFTLDALGAGTEVETFLFDHICYDLNERVPEYRVPAEKHDWFRSMTEDIWENAQDASRVKSLQVGNAIQQLCLKCMEWDNKGNALKSDDYAAFRRLLFREFRRLKMVKEYAAALSVTEKSLNELVKKHTGKSASVVIYEQVIMEAKRLLLTGMTAKEAAYNLNFDDPAHFSKFFKAQTGISPTEFRNVHA